MDVFYAFNDAYAAMAGISIFSLLENSSSEEKIVFHIVDSGISQGNLSKLSETILSHNQTVQFYKMPDFEQLTGKKIDTGRWNINVFSKLFVGSILPEAVKKVICIDCDTVVMHSLNELWSTDIENKIVAGVIECISPLYRSNLGKQDSDYYFNSGLVVFNVEEMRKQQYEDKFWACMQKYGSSLAYLDQDVINAVVPQNQMVLLHPKFNAITPVFCLNYKDFMETRGARDYYSETEYVEAQNTPYIIHYTTFFLSGLRPWFEGSKHPKVGEFLKYKELSLWKDALLWKDNRNAASKWKAAVIRMVPLFILKPLVAYLHGTIVPRKNAKKMMEHES